MKKAIIPFACLVFALSACGGRSSSEKQTDTTTAAIHTDVAPDTTGNKPPIAAAAAATDDTKAGAALIAKNDCVTCHKEHDVMVGPAYASVAAKYPATKQNIDKLADKVISGGSGVWGAAAMPPHGALSKDDAKSMVTYILSLK